MREKILYISIVIVIFALAVSGTYYYINKSENPNKNINEVNIKETNTLHESIEKVYDAVVYIESFKGKTLYSTGTGFVYKKDDNYAYIITNYHVIEQATKIDITNTGVQTYTATLLGGDKYADIAVLKITKDGGLKVATLKDSVDTNIGDTVFTIGSPLGKEYINSVTKGIISGKDRTVEVELTNGMSFAMNVLQMDAAVNPGNSGGPLCNVNGEVIAVNSMKLVESEVEGMGFAIPMESVTAILERLEKGEVIKRPYLGVEVIDVNDTWNLYYRHITISNEIKNGLVIYTAEENSPADIAGLKPNDIIIAIDNTDISSEGQFRSTLYKYSVGDTIIVKYIRDNDTKTVKVLLDMSVEES